MGCGVLHELNGPICDAALETTGSLGRLRELELTNHLVVPIDETRTTYRLHPLFRDFLARRARRSSAGSSSGHRGPIVTGGWRSRATSRMRCGWRMRVATWTSWQRTSRATPCSCISAGTWRRSTAGWPGSTGPCSRSGIQPSPSSAAWIHALLGRTERALAWLAAAERSPFAGPMLDGTPSKAPWISGIRAMMLLSGIDSFRADLAEARSGIPPTSPFVTMVSVLSAVGAVLTGVDGCRRAHPGGSRVTAGKRSSSRSLCRPGGGSRRGPGSRGPRSRGQVRGRGP